jgi:hypothetical protein
VPGSTLAPETTPPATIVDYAARRRARHPHLGSRPLDRRPSHNPSPPLPATDPARPNAVDRPHHQPRGPCPPATPGGRRFCSTSQASSQPPLRFRRESRGAYYARAVSGGNAEWRRTGSNGASEAPGGQGAVRGFSRAPGGSRLGRPFFEVTPQLPPVFARAAFDCQRQTRRGHAR